jgi:glutamate/aspartate transport system substrate-binding protein
MKLIHGLVIVALAATIASRYGYAQQPTGTLKKIQDTGSLVIGHRESSIPFSYYDDKQKVVGYSVDLCLRIVDAIKAHLKLKEIDVKYKAVTSATRIPLMAKGTIDLECGSTTNNLARQEQVSYTITHFVTATRFVSKKADNLNTASDLKSKTVVSTSGSTNLKLATRMNVEKRLDMNLIAAKDHAEAFSMLQAGRAVAFFMDDILLYGLVAGAKRPQDFVISAVSLSVEPYGIMLRKDDPDFKKVVDAAMVQTYKSGAINAIYEKWFLRPIPPKGVNLNVPMSAQLKKVIANPTDSGNPEDYD